MGTSRILSLAAGCLPEASPTEMIRAAAAGGWSHTGLWVAPDENWTDADTPRIADALAAARIRALDVEVIWLRPGGHDPSHERVLAWGAAIGARAALVVSSEPDMQENRRRWERLCTLAEREGIRVVLEPLPITEVRSLADARAIVEQVDHPSGGMLIDPIHLQRTGGTPRDVADLDPRWLPYAQFCDGVTKLESNDQATLLADAIDGREVPGEGELPLDALLEALPHELPLSLEIRSARWLHAWPDPTDRARALKDAITQWFEVHDR